MIQQLVRRLRPRRSSTVPFEYVPEGWRRAALDDAVQGWNVEQVPQAQLRWLDQFRANLAGTRSFGTRTADESLAAENLAEHNTYVAFAFVVARTALDAVAAGQPGISLLDWGGGAGQYAFLARAALGDVSLAYHCKDLPVQTAVGRRVLPDATFFTTDDEFAGRTFDLVFASGALHYVEDWRGALARLAAATGRYLFVTRLPTVLHAPSYVTLQRAYAHGYGTEFLGWALNRATFLQEATDHGLVLVREFVVGETAVVPGAPEQYYARGYLFRPATP